MSKSVVKLTFDHKINRKQSSLNRHTHRYKKLKLWETRYKWEGEYKEKKEVEMKNLEEKIAQNEMELAELKAKKKNHEKELKAKTISIWGKAMSKAAHKEGISVAEAKLSLLESGYLSFQDIKTVEDDIKAAIALILKRDFRTFGAYSKFSEETLTELRDLEAEFKLKFRIDMSNEINSLIDKNAEFTKVCVAKFDLKDKSLIDYIDELDLLAVGDTAPEDNELDNLSKLDEVDLYEDIDCLDNAYEMMQEREDKDKKRFAALNVFFGFDSEFLGDVDDYLKKAKDNQ